MQKWQYELAALMVLLTVVFYAMRWLIFPGEALHDEMLRFLVGDIAFLFLQVLLVTVFIDRVAQRRERDEIGQKLNMVVGAFFSETGTDLLGTLAASDTGLPEVRAKLIPQTSWRPEDYRSARAAFSDYRPQIHLSGEDLVGLKEQLSVKKSYLLGLLGNQSLLEHEQFTDLLWAITHFNEELEVRRSLEGLPPTDLAHLTGDAARAYGLLGDQWLAYLGHLQVNYPYLFSLAMRRNPLDPSARVTVSA